MGRQTVESRLESLEGMVKTIHARTVAMIDDNKKLESRASKLAHRVCYLESENRAFKARYPT